MSNRPASFVQSAYALKDPEVGAFLDGLAVESARKWARDPDSSPRFLQAFREWLAVHPTLRLEGLEDFHSYSAAATTGVFDSFYLENAGRSLRVLPGEYSYHRDVLGGLGWDWDFLLDTDQLRGKEFVVLSLPFAGDGGRPQFLHEVLDACERKRVPVLLDCAFWGLSQEVSLDLRRYSCIRKVAFSLSKLFGIGHLRCGVEFSREAKGPNRLLHDWDYSPKFGSYFGYELIRRFPLAYLYSKYRPSQLAICEKHRLRPSESILFGIGDESWPEFLRDRSYYRVCLTPALYDAL